VGAAVPLVLGTVASSAGLAPTMWILVLAPLALLAAARPRAATSSSALSEGQSL
jgi:hypothetical protein